MYNKDRERISITKDRGTIRLVLPRAWSQDRKQVRFSVGLPDTPDGWSQAEIIAKEIEIDYAKGQLKPLEEYRPKTAPKSIVKLVAQEKPDAVLLELWEKYTDFRASQVQETTLRLNYRRVESHIRKNPHKNISQASEAVAFLVQNNSPTTAKRIVTQWNACGDWAVKFKLLDENPFAGLASTIKNAKTQSGSEEDSEFADIDPFSLGEMKTVIRAFENHQKYCHYVPFVKFLFYTGCRTSEAVGLQWKDINDDCSMITFRHAIVCASGKLIRKRLKTQHFRKFPCNRELQQFLQKIKPLSVNPENSVFTSLTGKIIRADSFNAFSWRGCENKGKTYTGVVQDLANRGLINHYRPQYQTRHTFITFALNQGLDAKDVAKLVGNSPEIIYKHYAGTRIEEIDVPDLNL